MTNTPYQSYEQAAAAYLAEFDALLGAPADGGAPARALGPGAARAPAGEALVERAGAIADISQAMVPLAKAELAADDPALREGLAAQLAAQAAAELQLAAELLRLVEAEEKPAAEGERPRAALASSSDAAPAMALHEAVRSLHQAMEAPAGRDAAPRAPRAPAAAPATIEAAKLSLRQAAIGSAAAISDKARDLGGMIAVDLVTNTEWRAVVSGAAMVNKEIAAKLESLKQGLGALLERAAAAAARTLLNVYDKLLALLGKDARDAARKKVQGWLEQIKQEQKVDLLGKLMARLYRLSAFEKALDEWLAGAPAAADKVAAAAEAVQQVPTRFVTLAGYLKTVEDAVVLAKRFIKLPQVLAAAAAIQVLLLAVVVYSGYDYIGYRELRFPNLARGVAQVVQEALAA